MFYRLKDQFCLRGWQKLPWAVLDKKTGETRFVRRPEFEVLQLCNGQIDSDAPEVTKEQRDALKKMEKNGVVQGSETRLVPLAPDQEYKFFDNRFMSMAHWSITGRCNFRCRHCYMSAPDAKYGELPPEKCLDIVRELSECGISKVNLTGGEPLVRPDFFAIVDELLKNDIHIRQIYTNGKLVTPQLLDELEARGVKPHFSISHDGVGWHDWMRGIDGAEKMAEDALLLCAERGFETSVESAFHKNSIDSIEATMHRLTELGVGGWKTNPVSNSGNWLGEDHSLDLSCEELYDKYLEFIPKYMAAGAPLTVMLGGFFNCKKGEKEWLSPADKKPCKVNDMVAWEERRAKQPLCMSARNMAYIAADGAILPCIPLTGLEICKKFPKLTEISLKESLKDSSYLNAVTTPVSALLEHNQECGKCEHRFACNGGCRAAALSFSPDDYLGIDPWTCAYFKGGYRQKIKGVLGEK